MTVTDAGQHSSSAPFQVQIGQQVQTGQITSTAAANQSATAGAAASFNLGSFADTYSAASPWSVDVNWGDGSPDTTITTTTQGTLSAQSHTYQTTGTDTVTVTVTDAAQHAASATFQVQIGQPVQTGQITLTAPAKQTATAGTAASFNLGSFADTYSAASPWSVDVKWGDGSADNTFTTSTQGTLSAQSHTFQTAGADTVTVTVTDAAKHVASATFQVTVNAATVVSTNAVLTVNSLADTTSPGQSLTLREAIELIDGTLGRALTAGEQAQITGTLGVNNTIQFKLPAGPQTITLTGGALDITSPVTINGPGASNLTINGNNRNRDFIVGINWSPNPGLHVSINGLTIAGGNQVYGGGLLNFGTLTMSTITFANNTAGSSGGGGLYNVTVVTLNNCTFSGNTISSVGAGAGIDNITSATATINNCTFTSNNANGTGNSAGSGGGIANYGTMTIAGSTFTGNKATF